MSPFRWMPVPAFLLFLSAGNPSAAASQAPPPPVMNLTVLNNFDGKCAPATAASHCDPQVQDGPGVKMGNLVQGPPGDDNFYGITPGGGAHGLGTIFRVTPAGVVTLLYSFGDAGRTDGRSPSGGLTLGHDGNLYGTTYAGGQKGFGTIFRMARGTGQPQILYSFRNGTPDPTPRGQPAPPPLTPKQIDDLAASYPVSPPVLASDGNLYGVTPSSNPAAGVLYRLAPDGTLTCVHRFKTQESATFGTTPLTLTQGSGASLFGTTRVGALGLGTVFRFDPSAAGGATGGVTTIYSLRGNGLDGSAPNGVIQGQDGNLYGTMYNSGPTYRGVVFRLTPGGQYTVLHAFSGNASNPVAGLAEALQNDPIPPGASSPPSRSYYLFGASALNYSTATHSDAGILFRLSEGGDGTDFSAVYNFDGTTGTWPNVTPVLSRADSSVYGITSGGGKFGQGVFYRLSLCLPAAVSASGSGRAPAAAVGTLVSLVGAAQLLKPGGGCRIVRQGDSVSMGDQLVTGAGSKLLVQFTDSTQVTLGANTRLTIDDYAYNPATHQGKRDLTWIQGAFLWSSGLMPYQQDQIETVNGVLGIRGTAFIARYTATGEEIDLLSGSVSLTPTKASAATYVGPITINGDSTHAATATLALAAYNALKARLFH